MSSTSVSSPPSTGRTLVCGACERHLFDVEEKLRMASCCESLICDGCAATLLPMEPATLMRKRCPACGENQEWAEDSMKVIYFTHQVEDPGSSTLDFSRLAGMKANRIYQASLEEQKELERKHEALKQRYLKLREQYNLNQVIANETSVNLSRTQDALKAYQNTTEALSAEITDAKAKNDELRGLLQQAQEELQGLESHVLGVSLSTQSSSVGN
ncbi:hypothetical protein H1R20_g9820, partial [Candolleomyces eurysporus]